MNPKPRISIYCDSTNWDNSRIEAANVPVADRYLIPQTCFAWELPETIKPIWDALCQQFQLIDPNGWAASFIYAVRGAVTSDDTADPVPAVVCEIYRIWDDKTIVQDVYLEYKTEQEALLFFDTLTLASFWTELVAVREEAARKAAETAAAALRPPTIQMPT